MGFHSYQRLTSTEWIRHVGLETIPPAAVVPVPELDEAGLCLVKHQQGFTESASAQTVQALRQGLVEDQTPALVCVAQLKAHQPQRLRSQDSRHVEHVVSGRGSLVQGQRSLLQGGTLRQSCRGSGHAVQGDGQADGPGVQGLPEQDQLCGQHGGAQAADVEPDPPWRSVMWTWATQRIITVHAMQF